jgi:hypothetical protein
VIAGCDLQRAAAIAYGTLWLWGLAVLVVPAGPWRLALTVVAAAVALAGLSARFQLRVCARGIEFQRSCCGIAYRSRWFPLDAQVALCEPHETSPGGVAVAPVDGLPSEQVFGSARDCAALRDAVAAAVARHRPWPSPYRG